MRATTFLTATLASLVAAAPAQKSEQATISELDIREDQLNDKDYVKAVTFKLNADDAKDLTCDAVIPGGDDPTLPTKVFQCGDSAYSFDIATVDAASVFAIDIYHETGDGVGLFGTRNVPTNCRAGGNGPTDFVCNQIGGNVSAQLEGPQ